MKCSEDCRCAATRTNGKRVAPAAFGSRGRRPARRLQTGGDGPADEADLIEGRLDLRLGGGERIRVRIGESPATPPHARAGRNTLGSSGRKAGELGTHPDALLEPVGDG